MINSAITRREREEKGAHRMLHRRRFLRSMTHLYGKRDKKMVFALVYSPFYAYRSIRSGSVLLVARATADLIQHIDETKHDQDT